jgi:hypothetical protein
MTWGIRGSAGSVLATIAALALVALAEMPAAGVPEAQPCQGADCGVVTDPHGAQYVGSGGLLLPSDSFTGSDADRSDAATCAECRWALLPMCHGGQTGGIDCGGAATSCPPGQFRRIVMLWRPGDREWREVGLVCLVDGAPVTVDEMGDRLSDVVVEDVPDLRPSYQPEGGTLIGLPAIFDAGQPRTLGERQFTLVGFDIELHGRATWTWTFGDGGSMSTDEPGGAWPTTTVSHAYTRAGRYPVGVSAEWQAWFTVDGMGPWPVEGDPVVQTVGPLPLRVVEARAELITG